ncbi:MAG: 50S ribosomal protein L32, partial [Atopobium sp.]|nr:50S ribosomal protein L32 [Atopobium sp.]
MAVPKQKKGRGATHTRRSANSKLNAAARSVCPQCGAP